MNTSLLINGKLVESGKKQAVINPSSGEIIAQVSVASSADVESALQSSRSAFDSGPWPRLSFSERKNFLLKISRGILEKAGELANLESLNTGKPIKESTFMDIPSSAGVFEHFANNLELYLKEESPRLQQEAQCMLLREPIGVAVLIVPWNYPLLIASWKIAAALAAGDTVILKPSSLTPLTALELGKIITAAGLPKGVVSVLNASGDDVGQKLCADARVDLISFTGSNSVGKKIMEYASVSVKKLVMELGGKSAAIVLDDADLETTANSLLCAIFLNQGQMCTAMSRILVDEAVYDQFIKLFTEKAGRLKLGPGSDFESQMGPLISDAQRKKVMDYVRRAEKTGAKLLCGGKIPEEGRLKNGFFFEPAVIADVDPSMSIFKEEIFGPVVCVSKFRNADEAINLANDSSFALASSIWSKDKDKARGLAAQINAGTVWINTYGMFYPELPYGGFKQSGFGKELGREGFLEYTRLKNVIVDKNPEGKPLVNYWYGF